MSGFNFPPPPAPAPEEPITEELPLPEKQAVIVYEGTIEHDPTYYGFHTVTLEKVAGRGPVGRVKSWLAPRKARVGHVFTYTYKTMDPKNGPGRAQRALLREFPDEDILHWKEIR